MGLGAEVFDAMRERYVKTRLVGEILRRARPGNEKDENRGEAGRGPKRAKGEENQPKNRQCEEERRKSMKAKEEKNRGERERE